MDFLESLTPRERLLRAHRDGVRRLATLRVPLFGLPTGWSGQRRTGANEVQTGVWRDPDGTAHGEWNEMAELVHRSGASELSVRSDSLALPIDGTTVLDLLGSPGEYGSMDVVLAGDRIAFAAARGTDDWVARWAGYRVTVTLHGRRWPVTTGELQLVRVTDLAPYHEGRLRMLEQRSGFDLHD